MARLVKVVGLVCPFVQCGLDPLIHSPPTESQLGRILGCKDGDHVKNSEAKGCWIEWVVGGKVSVISHCGHRC